MSKVGLDGNIYTFPNGVQIDFSNLKDLLNTHSREAAYAIKEVVDNAKYAKTNVGKAYGKL